MDTRKFSYPCDVCGKSLQRGPHRYEGKINKTYDILVCDSCRNGNWDGWAPHYENKIIKIIQKKGLPLPSRNEKGWLPYE